MTGHTPVGVSVGKQDERCRLAVGGAAAFLNAAQKTGTEVGRTTRVDLVQGFPDRRAVPDRTRWHSHPNLVVENDQAEDVFGREPAEQTVDRLKRRDDSPATHRAASVKHHLKAGRITPPLPFKSRRRYP